MKEYRVVLEINVLFFQKNFIKKIFATPMLVSMLMLRYWRRDL